MMTPEEMRQNADEYNFAGDEDPDDSPFADHAWTRSAIMFSTAEICERLDRLIDQGVTSSQDPDVRQAEWERDTAKMALEQTLDSLRNSMEENRQLKMALERSEQELRDWRVSELKQEKKQRS